MRNASFSITTEQIKNKTKFQTRRLKWLHIKIGEKIQACVKCMGLKKGEKVEKLTVIQVVDKWREPLNAITKEECTLEGFPEMEPSDFVDMFTKHNKCKRDEMITVIVFKYTDQYHAHGKYCQKESPVNRIDS